MKARPDAVGKPQSRDPDVRPAQDAIANAVTAYRQDLDAAGSPATTGLAQELEHALEHQRVGQEALEGRARQQAAIVRLGLEALASRDLGATLELLVREAAAALGADFCSVVELAPDRTTFATRAEFGWPPLSSGGRALSALRDAQAAHTMRGALHVVSNDLSKETRFKAQGEGTLDPGARSGLSAVVHGKQQAWGAVCAYTRALRPFSDHDANFLQAIANLMALAVERERVESVLRNRSRQQAAVVRLGSEALLNRELEGTMDLLVRDAGATIRADFGCVLELDEGRSAFHLRASFGWPVGSEGAAALSTLGDSQAHYTVLSAGPVLSRDLRTETRFTVQPLVLAHGAVSGLSVIMQGKARAWGVLSVHAKASRSFSEDEVSFLQAVANLMAFAIERDRVEAALRNRNRQQASVASLGRRALVGPHLDDLFADAAREVASTLQLELCEVLQRNPDGQTMVLRAGIGWQPGLVGSAKVSSQATSQAGFTLNSEGPVVVSDLRFESRFVPSPILLDQGVVSGLSVLVPTRSGSFGVLGAYGLSPRAFTQDDCNFLQAVANLLASAIERHRVEGELRRHRDDLEGLVLERTASLAASNRELEAFSYTISHDLRAPLRSINGWSKILQRKHGDALPEPAKAMLVQIVGETLRMGKLIEAILSLSRLGSIELSHAAVDVSLAATQTLETLQGGDPSRTVSWSVQPGIRLVGDEGLLRLVLENLLGNAWKFTGRTEGPRIQVTGEPGGLRVEDNGAGFDMAHARELFQPFHRLHAPEDFEGTGIGLATVNRIVARHGGRVWAESSPGQGATFHVALPPYVPPNVPLAAGMFSMSHPPAPGIPSLRPGF